MSDGRYVIGWVHSAQCSALFARAMYATLIADNGERIAGIIDEQSSANISTARNNVVRAFLREHADVEWLLFVDSDMVWEPDAPIRLLAAADAGETPILGALCHGSDSNGDLFSTIFIITKDEDGAVTSMRRLNDYPDSGIGRCEATGAAFLLIHRRVLTAIEGAAFDAAFPWFQETSIDAVPVSEDITFCLRAGRLGFPVHVHTEVEVGHHKSAVLTKARLRDQQRLKKVLADA